jgi:acyl-CoA synthetase (AMP-forming)/AMP-acid ligase II
VLTIPSLMARAAERFGDAVAVIDGDVRLSYRELFERAGTFAAALVAAEVRPGDAVAIWAPNGVPWIVAALGTWHAGAVLVPVNTRFKGFEAADILLRSRARVLVTVTDFLGVDYVAMLRDAGIDLPDLSVVVVAGEWPAFLDGADDAARTEAARRAAAITESDVADILFTSGTTGTPKGVVQTHRGTVGVASDFVAEAGLVPGDRYLMVNPYFHMFGLKAGILAALAAGATMLPEPVFDADRVLHRVASERVTALPGPPTLYQSFLDHAARDRYDLASLRVAVTGAADIPVELIRRMEHELPFDSIVTGYGLTEAGTATSTGPLDDAETIATTVGRPRPGFEVRIDGAEPGGAGEVLLRGPTLMSHYLDDPTATANAFDPDGWLRTGDIGALDERGVLRIIGRSKDMFIVGGFNAYPAEIENLLLRHPGIRDVAVVGVPDERLGEVAMAYVVAEPMADLSGPAIVDWARAAMANYKAPRAVELVDALPRNATGKVLKDDLRARAGGGR